jgi:NADH-quinone oxidoreductase subunit J
LFLFVVMLLGAERAEDERDQIAWQRPVALGMGLLLLGEAIFVAFGGSGTALQSPATTNESFATPGIVGATLFSDYLLPFEITSVILLAALVGVVVLHQQDARSPRQKDDDALREMSAIAPEPAQPARK